MTSTASGIAWIIWRRHRLGLNLVLGIVATAILSAQLVPHSMLKTESLLALTIIPLSMSLMYLLAITINAEADMASTASCYPAHMFTLPVRSRDLVFWPTLFGTLAVFVGWIVVAGLVLIPRGVAAPLWWPAAMLAATAACLQALFWTPEPVQYLRVIIAVVMFPFLIALSVFLAQSGIPEWSLTLSFLALIPIAYVVAVEGVSKGRRGDGQIWRIREKTGEAYRNTPAFKSPAQAQLWIEWTRNGLALPFVVGFTCLLTLAPLILLRNEVAEMALKPAAVMAGEYGVNQPARLLIGYFLAPLWYAAILGCGVRKSDTRRKDLSLNPLLATRPMTSGGLVFAKYRMAARSTITAWGLLLGLFGGWLVIPQSAGDFTAPFGLLLVKGLSAQIVAGAMGVIAILIFWTWKNQVSSLFIDLTGRAWLVHGYPIAMMFLITIGMIFAVNLATSPDSLRRLLAVIPVIASIAATAKLIAGALVISKLMYSRLIRPDTLVALGGVWLLAAGLLFAFARWLLPQAIAPSGYILTGVVLFMPLVRLSLAPLALNWNRHR